MKARTISFLERLTKSIGSIPSLILHTAVFAGFFIAVLIGVMSFDTMLLFLTTIVSLEAIYLSIFIQMTVNQNTASLREVEENIDEIQEDVEELGEDIDEIQEDIDEIQEDVEELNEDEENTASTAPIVVSEQTRILAELTKDVARVLAELEALKKGK